MEIKRPIKVLALLSCALVFMGNKGCESEEAIKRGRILKRSISSFGIQSREVKIGDQISIDLEGILSDQFQTELDDSLYFVTQDRWGGTTSGRATSRSYRNLAKNKSAGECTNDLPEAFLAGRATEFELGNEYGVSIGFGPGGAFGGILNSADFVLKQMTMGLDVHAYQPLSGSHIASAKSKGVKNDFGGGVGLNLGILSPKFNFMSRQPVADVVRKTLRSGLDRIGEKLEALEPWSARVFQERDTHILINAGSKHGLKKGDTLYISNVEYFWEGEPCESRLRYQLKQQDRDNPLAIVILDKEPSLDIAEARVLKGRRNMDIQEGARASIYYLKGSKDENDPLPEMLNPEEVLR